VLQVIHIWQWEIARDKGTEIFSWERLAELLSRQMVNCTAKR